jgi:hypothetical protein
MDLSADIIDDDTTQQSFVVSPTKNALISLLLLALYFIYTKQSNLYKLITFIMFMITFVLSNYVEYYTELQTKNGNDYTQRIKLFENSMKYLSCGIIFIFINGIIKL